MPRCLRNGFADIGKVWRMPIERERMPGPIGEDRHALARVVGAAPGRVAAVIGGQDDDIAGFQLAVAHPAAAASKASSAAA